MMELPLFPLNTVLFPGMPLQLHIFEERYKLMINRCIEQREPFGVALISNDRWDTNPSAEPYKIGCTAQITQVEPLGGGRMKITAVGRDRFQIMSFDHNQPYLVGNVELYPLIEDQPNQMRQHARKLQTHVSKYLELLKESGQVEFQKASLPDNPTSLAYLAAVLLQTSQTEKQELLAMHDVVSLLDDLTTTYRREVTLLSVILSPPNDNDYRGMFSLN